MSEPKPSWHPSPAKPRLALPRGACDTHFHVFGPQARFPFAANRSYTPADAPKEKLFEVHRHLGIERGVVVQAGPHGFDNSAAADLIAAKPGAYVGVALLPPSTGKEQLGQLNTQGFRGVRFNYMPHLGAATPVEEIIPFAGKLAEIGWHLQIHMDGSLIAGMAPALKRSPVPVVIDHFGRLDASKGLDQAPFHDLIDLLKSRSDFYVKVSGCERASRQPAPWKDALPFARRLVEEFPERTLWGTDWPHPNLKEVPDDGVMVDNIAEIAPTEAQRKALLVDNPRKFYGFTA